MECLLYTALPNCSILTCTKIKKTFVSLNDDDFIFILSRKTFDINLNVNKKFFDVAH